MGPHRGGTPQSWAHVPRCNNQRSTRLWISLRQVEVRGRKRQLQRRFVLSESNALWSGDGPRGAARSFQDLSRYFARSANQVSRVALFGDEISERRIDVQECRGASVTRVHLIVDSSRLDYRTRWNTSLLRRKDYRHNALYNGYFLYGATNHLVRCMLISAPRIPNKPNIVQAIYFILVVARSTLRIDPTSKLAVGFVLVGNACGSVFFLV